MSEEALQIAVKRREEKSKGEKKRYKHLNAEFQRIPRRDKKAIFSDQCKEIEENNRLGNTRDLFKKIRDSKGTFHVKMGSIKDRNGLDLREAEDIKKRWQEYTEELYKKNLHDPDSHDDVITNLEPGILECEVKGALFCPWDFPSENTGVGCHPLLQGIFPTQELNPGLPRCRRSSVRATKDTNL